MSSDTSERRAEIRATLQTQLTSAKPNALTSRELQVVQLLAQGKSNRDIANTLFVSQNTAITHVRHIMTKLELGSRAAVAAWAVRNRLD